MSRFLRYVEKKYGEDATEKYTLPPLKLIYEYVEKESEEVAREIVKELIRKIEPDKDIEDLIAENDDLIHENIDILLTWTFDNLLVAYAYSGKYFPETLANVPKTIDDYAQAVAYEVWHDKICEKVQSELLKISKILKH